MRHGTHVVSQIFADGDCGLAGIAPRCRGLVLPVYPSDEQGRLRATTQIDLARAIHLAVERGANIINISGGQLSGSDEADAFLAHALAQCEKAGILVVAAAGNDGCDCLHVPAAVRSVLAVGALDATTGEPAAFSNWGRAYGANGLLAPGTEIPGADSAGGITARSGTSYAAPIVAGAAALLMSLQVQRGGSIDARAVRSALLRGVDGCDDSAGSDCRGYLAGTLNVERALGLLFPDDFGADATLLPGDAQDAALQEAALQPITLPRRDRDIDAGAADCVGPFSTVPGPHAAVVAANHIRAVHQPEQKEGNVMLTETQAIEAAVVPSGVSAEAAGNAAAGTSAILSTEPGVTPSGGCAGCAGAGGAEGAGGCGCAACAGEGNRHLVYALGELSYDLGTEAHRDSLIQSMEGDPHIWDDLVKHLRDRPWDAEAVTWVLRIDATPIYIIRPSGPWAADTYRRLIDYLDGQNPRDGGDVASGIDRISLPGWIDGSATLSTGEVLPVVEPALRGLYAWDTKSLVEQVTTVKKAKAGVDAGLSNFLERVYYELRNLGVAPQDRALNAAATNAFQAETAFSQAVGAGRELDEISVEKSPICRQDSDCWDVSLAFFDPANDRAARRIYRFTIDVSDVIPVSVGPVRSWSVR